MDEIVRAGEQLDQANLTAVAFHEPKKLRAEFSRLRARAVALNPLAAPSRETEALREKARAMVERIERGGVLSGGADAD